MLKWELIEDESRANRWLILIAYVIGISIGVHLLNLVTIPALGLIYYFKKYPNPTRNGLVVLGVLTYGIRTTQQRGKVLFNTALVSLAFILIGYSSYTMIVIRSGYDPPIDENDPEDVMSVVSYLLREQYGSRPLLYGQYFTARTIDQVKGAPVYTKGKDKYVISDYKLVNKYDPKQMTILPRMWSAAHASEAHLYRQPVLYVQAPDRPYVLALFYVELCRPGKRHPGCRLAQSAGCHAGCTPKYSQQPRPQQLSCCSFS